MIGKAGAVTEQVAQRDMGRDPRVLEGEPGQMRHHRRGPRHRTSADLLGNDSAGDRLRQRGDLKHSVGIDEFRLAGLANTEALGIDGAPILHDSHGHARDAAPGHQAGGKRVKLADRLVDLPRRNLYGENLRRRRWVGRHCRRAEKQKGGGRCRKGATPGGAPCCMRSLIEIEAEHVHSRAKR